jgi:citrate synthase
MDALTLDLVPAGEAAARLGIRRASLYAYVSRGLIRSFAAPEEPRRRLYAADDIAALVRQRNRLRRPRVAAATALDWGLPVLDTGITQVRDGRLFYRGRDALDLAETASFEAVARLLVGAPDLSPEPACPPNLGGSFLARAIGALADWRDAPTPAATAGAILGLIASAATGSAFKAEPIDAHLAAAWGAGRNGRDAIRRALILSADHELSASAFAVRVVASTGAGLAQAVVAGLVALSGPRHGGATDRVRTLMEEAAHAAGVPRLRERLRGSGPPVGFAHPLYPDGDPRGPALLSGLPLSRRDAHVLQTVTDAGGRPTLDTGLVLLERVYRLPRPAAFIIFAVGRTAGWLAHAVEQRATGALIRPRARYVVPDAVQ